MVGSPRVMTMIGVLLFAGYAAAQPVETGEVPFAETENTASTADATQLKLRALEARVAQLKERVFQSKARLNLLKEAVLQGVIAGSRTVMQHKNEMGGSFALIRLVYTLDGKEIYARADESGALDKSREFEVWSGSVTPGEHTLAVHMVYRGRGFGVFSYLDGYEFNVRSSHVFTAVEGRPYLVTVRAYERGNFTTELEDRPAVSFEPATAMRDAPKPAPAAAGEAVETTVVDPVEAVDAVEAAVATDDAAQDASATDPDGGPPGQDP